MCHIVGVIGSFLLNFLCLVKVKTRDPHDIVSGKEHGGISRGILPTSGHTSITNMFQMTITHLALCLV